VDKVISSGGTAIAVAAEPTLGRAGYWLMTVTALFATTITAAHLRIRAETGASLPILILAIVAAGAVFVTFVFTTLIHEPASIVTLAGVLVLSAALDYGWKHFHATRAKDVRLAH
jgi:hypothetical protein